MSNLAQRLAAVAAAYRPSWSWDFRGGSLPPGASFTRASGATYFDASGALQTAGSNAARFDHGRLTGTPLGYLAEPQSTNAWTWSADLTNAAWGKTRSSVVASATLAPDGTPLNVLVEDTTAANSHFLSRAASFVAGSSSGFCFIAGAGLNRNWAFFAFPSAAFTSTLRVYFDLTNGVVGNISTGITAGMRSLGGGLYLCWAYATATTTISTSINVGLANANGGISYDGDGVSNILLSWMQSDSLNVGITSYIPTTSAAATRAGDVLTMPLTSLSGWDATKSGLLVTKYRLNAFSAGETIANIDDNSSNNYIQMLADSIGTGRARVLAISGGATQFNVNTGFGPAVLIATKYALKWGTAGMSVARDGAIISTTAGPFVLPVAPTRIRFGTNVSGAAQLNGPLESVAYYPGDHSDAFVQAVSR